MRIRLPKIFLDSADPQETKSVKGLLGFVDGQTTNPTLIAKNFKGGDFLEIYKEIVGEIEKEIAGPISVEVYSDWETKRETMLKQAKEMSSWGRNIQIKFPTTNEGLAAAADFLKDGGKANMTLVFTQEQAAAVYSLALHTEEPTFVSPFLGRFEDRGYFGLDLLKNIKKMYKKYDKLNKKNPNVKILASSIRNLDYFYASIFLGVDILTVPYRIIVEWLHNERWIPDSNYRIDSKGLKSIQYLDLPFHSDFSQYKIEKISGDLLDEGLKKFATDWKSLISS